MSLDLPSFNNLSEVLNFWKTQSPHKTAFTFLLDGDQDAVSLTYGELYEKAQNLAAHLTQSGFRGQRALLLYPPGLDYIIGFWACLESGVIAVPAYPPDLTRLERSLPRLQAVIENCEATLILTTEMIGGLAESLIPQAPQLKKLTWICSDTFQKTQAQDWQRPSLHQDSLAFLQYTSGSTGTPKGVKISHGNLLHNLEMIRQCFGVNPNENAVCWLPPYHDMGLIGGILGNLYNGMHSTLLSPLHFLQRPLRWLHLISKLKSHVSGGPNFAYELCARKVKETEKANLDLSSWKIAFTGAEAILPQTLERFTQAFAPCGFDPKAFYPCYGLAEGTLMVTGSRRGRGIKRKKLEAKNFLSTDELEAAKAEAKALELIGSGQASMDQKVRIAKPDTLQICSEGQVGEIFVYGPSVAQGYWQDANPTQVNFEVYLGNPKEGPFLRTGDLGFWHEGELYVTGRLKDLIIIRGQNHYPQDIENTVSGLHPALRPGCAAAFSVCKAGEEKLIFLQELEPKKLEATTSLEMLAQKIRRNILQYHEIKPYEITLIEKGSLPKTSSGKIQRYACRQAWQQNSLAKVFTLQPQSQAHSQSETSNPTPPDLKAIQDWLVHRLADQLELAPEAIDPHQPLSDLGLDSKDAVNFSGELEDWLGKKLSPTLLWKYPTPNSLAGYLAQTQNCQS